MPAINATKLSSSDWVEMCKEGVKLSIRGGNDSQIAEILIERLIDKTVHKNVHIPGPLERRFNPDSVCNHNRNPYCNIGLVDDVYYMWRQLVWLVYQIPQKMFGRGYSLISQTDENDPFKHPYFHYLRPIPNFPFVQVVYETQSDRNNPDHHQPDGNSLDWYRKNVLVLINLDHFHRFSIQLTNLFLLFSSIERVNNMINGCERMGFLSDLELSQIDNVGLFIRNIVIKTGLHLPQSFIDKVSEFFIGKANLQPSQDRIDADDEDDDDDDEMAVDIGEPNVYTSTDLDDDDDYNLYANTDELKAMKGY